MKMTNKAKGIQRPIFLTRENIRITRNDILNDVILDDILAGVERNFTLGYWMYSLISHEWSLYGHKGGLKLTVRPAYPKKFEVEVLLNGQGEAPNRYVFFEFENSLLVEKRVKFDALGFRVNHTGFNKAIDASHHTIKLDAIAYVDSEKYVHFDESCRDETVAMLKPLILEKVLGVVTSDEWRDFIKSKGLPDDRFQQRIDGFKQSLEQCQDLNDFYELRLCPAFTNSEDGKYVTFFVTFYPVVESFRAAGEECLV